MKVIEKAFDVVSVLAVISFFVTIMVVGAYFFPSSFLGSMMVSAGSAGTVSTIVFNIAKWP